MLDACFIGKCENLCRECTSVCGKNQWFSNFPFLPVPFLKFASFSPNRWIKPSILNRMVRLTPPSEVWIVGKSDDIHRNCSSLFAWINRESCFSFYFGFTCKVRSILASQVKRALYSASNGALGHSVPRLFRWKMGEFSSNLFITTPFNYRQIFICPFFRLHLSSAQHSHTTDESSIEFCVEWCLWLYCLTPASSANIA